MSRPFAIYPLSFDGYTRGYWRFAETGGRLAGVIGPAMTITAGSPVAVEEGYRFDLSEGQQLRATFDATGATLRTLTVEAWMRGWANLSTVYGELARYYADANNRLMIEVRRHPTPASSYINASMKLGGSWMPTAGWSGQAVADLLDSPAWWHIAAVFDGWSPRTLRLFVNGILRASATPTVDGFPAGVHYASLGYGTLSAPNSGIVDEVRVSSTSRYAVNFTPVRYGEGRRGLARGPGLDGLFAGLRQ